MKVPTASELIADYGVKVWDSKGCSCCGKARLYRVPVEGPAKFVYLCSTCDTEK